MRSFQNNRVTKKRNISPSPTIFKYTGLMTASLGNAFTKDQLKELERQIMIYKYFVACVSIPSYLLAPIPTISSRRIITDPMTSSSRNINDPVEGRCRRSDGKKWRCSRYVAPNNKYCDRHMHRGSRPSRKSGEHRINHTGNYSSHFIDSTASHPYLQPSVSFDNPTFGAKLAPRFDHSNKQPRMLNGDPMSLGASNSGWQNNISVNQYTNSLPKYNNLVYNPLLVPLQSEKPQPPIDNNVSPSINKLSISSLDPLMMGPLGEILMPSIGTSVSDSTCRNPSGKGKSSFL